METIYLLINKHSHVTGHGQSTNYVSLAALFTVEPNINPKQISYYYKVELCPAFQSRNQANAYKKKHFEDEEDVEILELPVFLGHVFKSSEQLSLLQEYTKFLQKEGYLDTDATDEEPTAINEFLKTKQV